MSDLALSLIRKSKEENATYLDLGNCGLTELPDELFELTKLEVLILGNQWWDWRKQEVTESENSESENCFSQLPESIGQLINLQQLVMCGTRDTHWMIKDLKPLRKLSNLNSLNLGNNRVSDLKSLKHLPNLTKLDFGGNQLRDLTPLEHLPNLTHLNFIGNQVSDLNPLARLSSLIQLYFSGNKVCDLKPVEHLISLEEIYCSYNKIADLKPLEHLSNLRVLNLIHNRISDLKPLIHLIKSGVEVQSDQFFVTERRILVEGNPLTSPPLEIVDQGNGAILQYFRQIEEQEGTEPLYEAKLIIVGEPGAGKTTLMQKLLDENYQVPRPAGEREESTVGVNIHEGWTFQDINQKDVTFSTNLWDFGGQVIQYMTHQFFLTPSALYVLVADDRKQNTNFPYWFEIIHLLGREGEYQSPILVLLNENRHRSVTNYDHTHFRRTFPNSTIDLVEVDLSVNDQRFYALRGKIQEMLCSLRHVGYPLPKKWRPIREELHSLSKTRNHILEHEYSEICRRNNIHREEDQLLLSGYLHRLGSIVHFQKDPGLRDFIILNPQWAVDAVYAIVENDSVKKAEGVFTTEMMDTIWEKYSRPERGRLLSLMKKDNFEICYEIAEGKYIAPQLLENVRPVYPWDKTATLKFQYGYTFLPKGIVTRLIVRLNEFIAGDRHLVWQKGVVFEKDGCRVQVTEEDFPRQVIELEASGPQFQKKYSLSWARNEIEAIHKKWFSNIHYEQKVPCICKECQSSDNPYFFEHTILVRFLEKNKKEATCGCSVIDVPILQLLEGVFVADEMKRFQSEMREGVEFLKHGQSRLEFQHELQTSMLGDLQESNKKNREQLEQIMSKLDETKVTDGQRKEILQKIETGMNDLVEKLPTTDKIVAAWSEVSAQAKGRGDIKGKFELTIPIIPFILSQKLEVAWDWKQVFTDLWKDLTKGRPLP